MKVQLSENKVQRKIFRFNRDEVLCLLDVSSTDV